eukprot:g180.t1
MKTSQQLLGADLKAAVNNEEVKGIVIADQNGFGIAQDGIESTPCLITSIERLASSLPGAATFTSSSPKLPIVKINTLGGTDNNQQSSILIHRVDQSVLEASNNSDQTVDNIPKEKSKNENDEKIFDYHTIGIFLK